MAARPFSLRGYVVERLLGCGASGDVWQARAASSGARVALKRIPVRSDDQVRRAHAEAALLCALEHPNLVRLHSVVPLVDAVVLVLDLADGGSLADLLAARGRLTPGEVITAIAPVAAALAYLHGEGVVHGDVSAANILFTGAGVAMLADVGVARLTGDDGDADATPAYVDPTVAAGGVPGPQSDVFMLAGVALHALTGAPPWPGDSGDAALAMAAQGELDDVADRLGESGVPAAMAAVLGRALTVDPQRRGTAADLALDLRHSGRPVAVELSAGRPRGEPLPVVPAGPRHAAAGAGRAPSRAPAPPDRSRPPFERPSGAAIGAGSAPPTRMVGPRPRPEIPRGKRRRVSPRAVAIAGAAALAAGIAVVGTLVARAEGRPGREAGAGVQASAAHRSEVGAAAELVRLDGLRARAFAERRPALLHQVYVPGPLLTADTALLTRIVPPGCGLRGVRTGYSDVRSTAAGARIVLTVTATLPASDLVCAGHRRGRAAGAGPTTLRLELTHTAAGLRIAGQSRA